MKFLTISMFIFNLEKTLTAWLTLKKKIMNIYIYKCTIEYILSFIYSLMNLPDLHFKNLQLNLFSVE